MRIILFLLGSFLFINGFFMSLVSNFNLGVILTGLIGLFFLLWGVFYEKIKSFTKKGIGRILKWIVFALICIEIIVVGLIVFYGKVDNVSYTEDAVIVLGAGIHGDRVSQPLAERLNSAIEYHQKNPEALIVVTGGQGFEETVTEAYAMEKYLLERGVAPDKIIKEEKATSTNENMRFSKEILDGILNEDYEVVIITNDFHIYRGVEIAKMEGFENVSHKGADLKWYNTAPCYIRESLAVVKMWLIDM